MDRGRQAPRQRPLHDSRPSSMAYKGFFWLLVVELPSIRVLDACVETSAGGFDADPAYNRNRRLAEVCLAKESAISVVSLTSFLPQCYLFSR